MGQANYQGPQRGQRLAKVFVEVEIRGATCLAVVVASGGVTWTRRWRWEVGAEAESEAEVALKEAIVEVG